MSLALGRVLPAVSQDFVDRLPVDQQDALLARPARRAKPDYAVHGSLSAIWRLVSSDEPRLEALGKGAYFAASWASGETSTAPATAIERASFDFVEVTEEIEAAGRAAAGLQPLAGVPMSDRGRIAARGVEEWLAWVYLDGYPEPPWLMLDWSFGEIGYAVIGNVGAGATGLTDPVSRERFPYDVADEVDRIP